MPGVIRCKMLPYYLVLSTSRWLSCCWNYLFITKSFLNNKIWIIYSILNFVKTLLFSNRIFFIYSFKTFKNSTKTLKQNLGKQNEPEMGHFTKNCLCRPFSAEVGGTQTIKEYYLLQPYFYVVAITLTCW